MDTGFETKSITIGGQKVPSWVAIGAAGIALLFVILSGGQKKTSTTDTAGLLTAETQQRLDEMKQQQEAWTKEQAGQWEALKKWLEDMLKAREPAIPPVVPPVAPPVIPLPPGSSNPPGGIEPIPPFVPPGDELPPGEGPLPPRPPYLPPPEEPRPPHGGFKPAAIDAAFQDNLLMGYSGVKWLNVNPALDRPTRRYRR